MMPQRLECSEHSVRTLGVLPPICCCSWPAAEDGMVDMGGRLRGPGMQEQGPYGIMDMGYGRGKSSPPGDLQRPGSGRLKGGRSTDEKVRCVARSCNLPLLLLGASSRPCCCDGLAGDDAGVTQRWWPAWGT